MSSPVPELACKLIINRGSAMQPGRICKFEFTERNFTELDGIVLLDLSTTTWDSPLYPSTHTGKQSNCLCYHGNRDMAIPTSWKGADWNRTERQPIGCVAEVA